MLVLKNVKNIEGSLCEVILTSPHHNEIEGEGLTVLPALIDPHVHFRIPGAPHKEDWISGARAALQGGVTTVIDMPNNTPSCTTLDALLSKHRQIKEQLQNCNIPLRYHLYFGADKENLNEIPKAKGHCIGIKVFMGSSTGNLLIDDDKVLKEIFRIAADNDMLVSVHAEDEETIKRNKASWEGHSAPSVHSKIRTPEAAAIAVKKALALSQHFNTRLCILHVSSKMELDLIRKAKEAKIQVFAETSPHHLLLTTSAYENLGTFALVNPPLRELEDQEALWQALKDGTIDFIGTDHAPHTIQEKAQPYGKAPSGLPSIDLLLPLLLNAVNQGKLSLNELIKLTRTNIERIFRLEPNNDVVLVDLEMEKEVSKADIQTKCGWSPYTGHNLKGWPIYTILNGIIYKQQEHPHASSRNSL